MQITTIIAYLKATLAIEIVNIIIVNTAIIATIIIRIRILNALL